MSWSYSALTRFHVSSPSFLSFARGKAYDSTLLGWMGGRNFLHMRRRHLPAAIRLLLLSVRIL